MGYLRDVDWISVVSKYPDMENDLFARSALADLRATAEDKFLELARAALVAYLKVTQGQLPSDTAALAPYGNPPLDSSMLQRYKMLRTGRSSKSAMLIGTNPDMAVDPDHDMVVNIGINSSNSMDIMSDAVETATAAFRAANNGQFPQNPGQLTPYFTHPELAKKYLDRAQH